MLEGCLDIEGMHMKKHLIEVRQRWDRLYQKTMEYEKRIKAELRPLELFQTASSEFESWLDDVERKWESHLIGVSGVEEVRQQTEACQVRNRGNKIVKNRKGPNVQRQVECS